MLHNLVLSFLFFVSLEVLFLLAIGIVWIMEHIKIGSKPWREE